jgi:hypothetical protein
MMIDPHYWISYLIRKEQMLIMFNVSFRHIHDPSPKKSRSRKLNKFEDHCSYRLFLNPIRIAFGFVTILLIILCILSGLLYGLDLFLQSSCRLVHYDQSFLISFATGNSNI